MQRKLIFKWHCRFFLIFFSYWRFPYNWRNPIVYLATVSYELLTLLYFFSFTSCETLFCFGFVWFHISATNDAIDDLNLVNTEAKTKGDRVQNLKSLTDFIQFHCELKKLSKWVYPSTLKLLHYWTNSNSIFRLVLDFLDIYQPFIILAYTWSLVTICGSMLLIQMELVKYSQFSPPKLIQLIH